LGTDAEISGDESRERLGADAEISGDESRERLGTDAESDAEGIGDGLGERSDPCDDQDDEGLFEIMGEANAIVNREKDEIGIKRPLIEDENEKALIGKCNTLFYKNKFNKNT
jgi:hypothetical protein